MSEAMTAGLPATTAEALQLSKLRLGGEPKPDTHPSPVVAEPPKHAQEAAEPAAEAKPEGQPPEKPKAEFSWIPDPVLRAAIEGANLPDEALSKFKGWTASYTQKAQEAADLRKKASAWETVENDPRLMRAVADAISAAVKEPEPEAPFDYASATSEQIETHIRATAARMAEDLVNKRVVEPRTKGQRVLAAAGGAWGEWSGQLDEPGYRAAWQEAVNVLGEAAFMANPDAAPSLARPFLEKAALSRKLAALEARTQQQVSVAKRATSPAGTATVASVEAPPSAPPKKDGDAKTARERTLKLIAERYGWSASDLEAAARPGGR